MNQKVPGGGVPASGVEQIKKTLMFLCVFPIHNIAIYACLVIPNFDINIIVSDKRI